MESIDFTAGETYENEKGAFEVLEIEGDRMVIRWDTGEQLDTTVTLQTRIAERMQREERAAARRKDGSRIPASYGSRFDGFQPSDFKDDVVGTHWRCREQLGGAVTRLLTELPTHFQSRSIYRQTRVDWADVARTKDESRSQANFTVMVSPDVLKAGFFIERSTNEQLADTDWQRFIQWLAAPEHEAELLKIIAANDLFISDIFEDSLQEVFRASDSGGWQVERGESREDAPVGALHDFLAAIDDSIWINIFAGRQVDANSSVARGAAIAGDIAGCFTALYPLYAISTAS